MRRQDKKIAMKKANILFEQRCIKESTAFNWNGKYENEEEIEEGIFLGDDMENIEEVDTTDVEASQFFSDVDGERLTDKELDT